MGIVETLFTNAKLADRSLRDIGVSQGRIFSIAPAGSTAPAANDIVDFGGALVVPGFVEGHIHLDTSFYGDR